MQDIYGHIFTYCNYGSAYKVIICVCKDWQQLINDKFPNAIDDFSNHLLTLLKLKPYRDYDWQAISANINMKWSDICALDYEWNYGHVTNNPNITMEIINNNHKK